jgi:hypothetical protein
MADVSTRGTACYPAPYSQPKLIINKLLTMGEQH